MYNGLSPKAFPSSGYSYGRRCAGKSMINLRALEITGEDKIDFISTPKSNIVPITFPKSKRHEYGKERKYIPGPGSYNIDVSSINTPKANNTINYKVKELELDLINSNGTSETTSDPKRKGRHFSMAQNHKVEDYKRVSNPGPGAYQVTKASSFMTKQLSAIIGSSPRIPKIPLDGATGTNYYSHNSQEIYQNNGQIVFSKSRRKLHDYNENPGPADYKPEINEVHFTSTIGTFPQSPKQGLFKLGNQVPGPGKYYTDNDEYSKGVVLPRSIRFAVGKSRSPGPGAYDIIDQFTEKQKEFDKKARIQRIIAEAKSAISEGLLDLTAENLSRIKLDSLTLNLDTRENKATRSLLQNRRLKESKNWLDQAVDRSISPGPVYSPKVNTLEDSHTGAIFLTDTRVPMNYIEIKNDIPGPGSYREYCPEIKGSGIFLQGSREHSVSPTPKNVGPGAYESGGKKSILGGVVGRATRKIADYS